MSGWTGSGVDAEEIEVKFKCEFCGADNEVIAYETRWRDKAIAECGVCWKEKVFYANED